MRGKPVLETMRSTKREMFEEIYKRVVALKEKHPDWHLCQLVFEVVNSPAPKFYMYNPQNEMFAAFETNRSLLKNETYPKIKKFSPGFAGV